MPDRSYYRAETDTRLIEEAKDNPNRELAIALGERLEDTLAEGAERLTEAKELAQDFEIDADRLEDKVYELERKIEVLELMLATRDDEIAELKKGKA